MNPSSEVTIGIVNYNGIDVLPEAIRFALASRHAAREIIVADNGSTDGSREWLSSHHPEARLVALERNMGSAAARNALLQAAKSELVLLLDNDISLEPDSLGRLVNIMNSIPDAGICHPEILDDEDPDAYHYNGGSIHYLGSLIARAKPEPDDARPAAERYDVVSGGAMLVRRAQAFEIGAFDENYFFNWEDGDFSARMTLAGRLCLNVPGARARHRGKPRGTSKVFYQVRNRWFFMLKLYSWRTLFLALPMLCAFELLQAALLLKKGAFGEYWRANRDVVRSLGQIAAGRRAFRPLKKKRDREWLAAGPMYIPASIGRGALQRAGERVFYALSGAWWKLISPFC